METQGPGLDRDRNQVQPEEAMWWPSYAVDPLPTGEITGVECTARWLAVKTTWVAEAGPTRKYSGAAPVCGILKVAGLQIGLTTTRDTTEFLL